LTKDLPSSPKAITPIVQIAWQLPHPTHLSLSISIPSSPIRRRFVIPFGLPEGDHHKAL
jgi:hypothetical protein